MKRTFTKLMAALALLVFMTPSLAGWGQTRATGDEIDRIANIVSGKAYYIKGQRTSGNSTITEYLSFTDEAGSQSGTSVSNTSDAVAIIFTNVSDGVYTLKTLNGNYIAPGTSNGKISVATSATNVSVSNQTNSLNSNNCIRLSITTGSNTWAIQKNKTASNFGGYKVTQWDITLIEAGSIATITSLSYTGTPTTTTYEAGDSFDPTGITVTATYSDASTQDVTASVVWTPDPLTQGTTSVTGTYSGLNVTVPGITVNAPAGPDIVLNYNNSPFTATSANTNTASVTLNGIQYDSYGGYNYTNSSGSFLSINREIEGYLGNNTVLCGNIKKIVVNYSTGGASLFTMYEGATALAETTTVSPSGTGTGAITYTFSGNNGYFKFKRTTTGTNYSDYCNINSISIYLKDCDNPEITVSTNSLSGFTYVEGNGPSAAQTFTVSGTHLTANLNLSLGENSDFEISQSENSGYANSIALPSDGTVANTTIYARLKAGKAKGNYSGTITLTSTYATNKTVSLSGTVTSQTYTLSDQSGENGSISFSASPVEAGTHVTLTPTPVSDAYYFVPGSWSFFNESLEEVTSSIVFVTGETNVIEMPAFNLLVDASFQAKPNHNVTIASGIENGTVTASPTSAYAGQTITLTVTPGTNCYLTSLAATYVDENQETQVLTITNNTFVMPNYNVTVTATFASNTFEGSFAQFSETLVEGDYLIVYNNKAMNNVVTSNRFGYETVSASQNGIVANPSRNIVWHIAPSATEGYWTIYNAKVNQYVNATASSTSLNLVDNPTYASGAKWAVTEDESTYDFRCKANEDLSSGSTVRYIRYYNDVYGHYAGSNGGALTLYKFIPPTAPVWSALPTPNIYTGNEYELTLTDYVTGNPAPNITLATEVSSDLYEYEDGHFTFQTNTAGTYEFTFTATNSQGSVSATLTITVAAPEEYDLTVTLNDHITGIFVFNAANQNNPLIAEGASETIQVLEGTSIIVSPDVAEGYVLESLIVNNTDVTSQIDESGAYTFTVTGNVTITATAVFNPYITLSGEQMANMTTTTGSYCLQNITINGFYWEAYAYRQNGNAQYLQINTTGSGNATGSYIKLPVFNGKIEEITCTTNSSTKKLYFNTTNSASNPIATEDNNSTGIERTIDLTGVFYQTGYIVSDGSIQITNITVRYSPYQDMTGNTLETIGNDATVSIPTDANVTATNLEIPESSGIVIKSGATLTVSGTLSNDGNANNIVIEDGGQLITTSTNIQATAQKKSKTATNWTTESNGWSFIASPITEDLTTANINGLVAATATEYDLYYLNEEHSKWYNYKATGEGQPTNQDAGFKIVHNKGYLYASKNNTTINFVGTIQPDVTAGIDVSISKNGEGFNLVGNPFPFNAYVNMSYYTLDETGETVSATPVSKATVIKPGTGIIVQATGTENETVTFRRTVFPDGSSNNGNIQIALAQQATNRGNSTIDNAIVSFNEESQLEKFYFGTQNANIYIPQNHEEYAIAYSDMQGEMPVNFKANEDGQYTITVNPEDVEMNYLHLIDNIAGKDIDLLATPSYTFNAKSDDYTSRFRLVFSANNANSENGNEDFAFISNGQIIVNGTGTVQVIDMLGRQVLSSQANSEIRISNSELTPGVYVLRLIDGSNVKSQKIVVR